MNAAPLRTTDRQNARTWGSRFTSRWIEPGVVSYTDVGGDVELLSKEAIDRHCASFVGRPVVVKHSKISPQNMQDKAVGYISKVWHDPADGWYYCEGVIFEDQAKDLIGYGWSVSCGYRVTGTNECGGVHHNIRYAREITAFEGEHLALVQNPRYEGATIRLNSKSTKDSTVNPFKLLQKILSAPDAEKPADTLLDVSPESTIEVSPGKPVALSDLVARYNESSAKAEKDAEDEAQKKADHENAKKLEEDEAKKKSDADKENAKKLEEDEAKKKAESDRENAKKDLGLQAFKTLAAAAAAPAAVDGTLRTNSAETLEDKLARGRARYGRN